MKYKEHKFLPALLLVFLSFLNTASAQTTELWQPLWSDFPGWYNTQETPMIFDRNATRMLQTERYRDYVTIYDLQQKQRIGRSFGKRLAALALADEAPIALFELHLEDALQAWNYAENTYSAVAAGEVYADGIPLVFSADGNIVCYAEVRELPDREYDSIMVVQSIWDSKRLFTKATMRPLGFLDPNTLCVRQDDGRLAYLSMPSGDLIYATESVSLDVLEVVEDYDPASNRIATILHDEFGNDIAVRLYDLESERRLVNLEMSEEEVFYGSIEALSILADASIIMTQSDRRKDSHKYVPSLSRITTEAEVIVLSNYEKRYFGLPHIKQNTQQIILRDIDWAGGLGIGDAGGIRAMDPLTGVLEQYVEDDGWTLERRFSPDGSRLVYVRRTEDFVIVNAQNGQKTHFHQPAVRPGDDVLWTRDGQAILYAGPEGIYQWNIGAEDAFLRYDDNKRAIIELEYTPDSNYIAGIGPTTVKIWNVDSGELLHSIDLPYRYDTNLLLPGPGRQQLTFVRDPLDSGTPRNAIITATDGSIQDIQELLPEGVFLARDEARNAYSSDGRYYAHAKWTFDRSRTGGFSVYDLQMRQEVFVQDMGDVNISQVRFTGDGKYLITCGSQYSIRASMGRGSPLTVWDFRRGEALLRIHTLSNADDFVKTTARFEFSPDEQQIFLWAGAGSGLYELDFSRVVSSLNSPQDELATRSADQKIALNIIENSGDGRLSVLAEFSNAGSYTVALVDLSGRTQTLRAGSWLPSGRHIFEYDTSQLQSGVYIIHIEGSGYSASQSIQIVH